MILSSVNWPDNKSRHTKKKFFFLNQADQTSQSKKKISDSNKTNKKKSGKNMKNCVLERRQKLIGISLEAAVRKGYIHHVIKAWGAGHLCANARVDIQLCVAAFSLSLSRTWRGPPPLRVIHGSSESAKARVREIALDNLFAHTREK